MFENLEYPVIGSEVTYIRSTPEGEVMEGVGIACAIFLDPRSRLMVQVRDGGNTYNVDFVTINRDEAFFADYAKAIKSVADITAEGNELVTKTVTSYNAQVDEVYNSVLGEPIHVEIVQPEPAEEESEAA